MTIFINSEIELFIIAVKTSIKIDGKVLDEPVVRHPNQT